MSAKTAIKITPMRMTMATLASTDDLQKFMKPFKINIYEYLILGSITP